MANESKVLKLTIATPEGILYDGVVDSVKLPGTKSAFTVLPLHAPIISSLDEGTVTYTNGEDSKDVIIKGGFVQVKNNEVSVCVEV
ncbi:MAG: F0F1 ATP synthase subunit epsilon [Phocaeicola sp.]|uniref:F0F1 ATP synthase subunit epsilon n=1 Tax=Phocaeicola TaxID=909656 RepID=UPI00234F6F5C|nr:F0F1 ATP synthase subunit epsilon [Phocaeicola oris]MCE2615425.1 F0F1 ATP synthase subunit epsilon [Phocaeicola oris]